MQAIQVFNSKIPGKRAAKNDGVTLQRAVWLHGLSTDDLRALQTFKSWAGRISTVKYLALLKKVAKAKNFHLTDLYTASRCDSEELSCAQPESASGTTITE